MVEIRSEVLKVKHITKFFYNIKVTFQLKYDLIRKLCLYDISIDEMKIKIGQ